MALGHACLARGARQASYQVGWARVLDLTPQEGHHALPVAQTVPVGKGMKPHHSV